MTATFDLIEEIADAVMFEDTGCIPAAPPAVNNRFRWHDGASWGAARHARSDGHRAPDWGGRVIDMLVGDPLPRIC